MTTIEPLIGKWRQIVVFFAFTVFVTSLSWRETMASDDALSAYDFSFPAIDAGEIHLSEYEGKAILLVNTASMCGFTPQYDGLQNLWETYRDDGLVVLGVPSADFGGQEYSEDADILDFCEVNFDVDFPLSSKATVKGPDAHPFYKWAEQEMGADNAPQWNFHKYLIGRDGKLVASFDSRTKPDDAKIVDAIRDNLSAGG